MIYMCVYICIVFPVRSCTCLLITLTARRTAHFTQALRTYSAVALTTAAYSSIAYTPWKKRKQEKAVMGEGNQTE